jgi:hypothetical protein
MNITPLVVTQDQTNPYALVVDVDVNWKADLDIVLAIKEKFAAGLTTTLNVTLMSHLSSLTVTLGSRPCELQDMAEMLDGFCVTSSNPPTVFVLADHGPCHTCVTLILSDRYTYVTCRTWRRC